MQNQTDHIVAAREGKNGPVILNRNIERFGGIVCVELLRKINGKDTVIDRRDVKNTVVNSGKKQILRMAAGLNLAVFDNFRIGTSGAAVASNQTNVLSPVASTRKTANSITISGTRTLQLVISYPSGGGSISANGIQEVVILNQNTSPGGCCLMRATFTSVNKTTSDKLKISYSLRIT
jgi:hypothetical protein